MSERQTIDPGLSFEVLSSLPPSIRAALISMYNGEPQLGSDGERHEMDAITGIKGDQGMWMYGLCRAMKPQKTLEIGLAYGYSTLYFLSAIHDNGFGLHTSVDPYQRVWHGIGSCHARNLGMAESFAFVDEKGVSAMVHFADRGETFEVIYIDGSHHFDDALVDFTLAAQICPMAGCIILDDMWMPAVQRAVAFIRTNRTDFEELKTPVRNIAVFRRVGEDARPWTHYVEFLDPLQALGRLTPGFLRSPAKAIARLFRR